MPALAYRDKLPRPDDPDILASLYSDIMRGMPARYAAVRAGITETTLYHWRMQGEAQLATDGPQAPLRELGSHALFVQTLKEAEAACVDEALTEWRGDPKGWTRWATLLERRDPENFGRRDHVQVDQRTLSVNVSVDLPPGALPALRDIIDRQIAAGAIDAPALEAGTPTPGTD